MPVSVVILVGVASERSVLADAGAGIVSAWVGHDASDFEAAGVSMDAVLDETATREPDARRRAHALVDAFLERAGVPSGR